MMGTAALALLFPVASAVPTASSPEALHAHYNQTQKRCSHGHTGVIIMLHDTATPHAFRRELEATALPEHTAQNRWAYTSERQGVVSLHAIHPATLRSVVHHRHTQRVQANCVVKHERTLPVTLPVSLPVSPPSRKAWTAGVFAGNYTDELVCSHTIVVANPHANSSAALLTRTYPKAFSHGLKSAAAKKANCESNATVVEQYIAEITLASARHGQITVLANAQQGGGGGGNANVVLAAAAVGVYKLDANGRLQDHIDWERGSAFGVASWTKIPGASYEKDSSIGPRLGAEARTRNPHAFVRWNWGLDRIDQRSTELDDEYSFGNATGKGVVVYNLDTGVYTSHHDFGGRAKPGYSVRCSSGEEDACLDKWVYRGVVTDAAMARDPLHQMGCDIHGTHTSSTAVGRAYGVASKAEVVAVQVLDCTGESSIADVMAGIDWVIDDAVNRRPRRPSVISLSLGGDGRDDATDRAIREARRVGILTVVAAGNSGIDACGGSPAAAAEALTVGATGMVQPSIHHGELIAGVPPTYDERANFSDYGPCVDVFAPGVEILAAIPVYGSPNYTSILSGTSMATPIVAGIVAQILGLHPTFSPDDVTRAIICLCLDGVIRDVDPYTHNRLVQGGERLLTPAARQLIAAQRAPKDEVWDATSCRVPDRDPEVRSQRAETSLVPSQQQHALVPT